MDIVKIDLYKELQLHNYHSGGAFIIENTSIDLEESAAVFRVLDKACTSEKLIPLGEDWNEINYAEFNLLLNSALQFDLGFTRQRVMTIEQAQQYYEILTKGFDFSASRYFTNCFDHFWNNESNSFTSNSISQKTLDLAVSIVSKDKILFVYFLFED